MNYLSIKKTIKASLFILTFFATSFTTLSAQSKASDVTIIELNQTVGQFETQKLNLTPGKYQFRVVNVDVDKEVGFVIQKSSDKNNDVMKTAVANSFTSSTVKKGAHAYTGVVDLTEGSYVYSCPLNPTPHYTINVK